MSFSIPLKQVLIPQRTKVQGIRLESIVLYQGDFYCLDQVILEDCSPLERLINSFF
jgi:hypothetical protein